MNALQLVAGTILFAGLLVTAGCGSSSASVGLGADAEAGDSGDATTEDAPVVNVPSNVVSDGYLTTGPWAGYGFTATDPGAAQIVPACGADSCDPPFCWRNSIRSGRAMIDQRRHY